MFNAGSAVPTLNRNDIHSLPVLVPPIDAIEKYENLIRPFFLHIYQNNQEAEKLAATRDYLLPRLLSGEVSVGEGEAFITT
jgi:type I restriction enzyme S subunit